MVTRLETLTNFFRQEVPWHLEKRYHSAEKHAYLSTVERLVEFVAQTSNLPIIVLGSGGGGESFAIIRALDYVGADNSVYNFDINRAALKRIRERRIREERLLTDTETQLAKEEYVCGTVERLPFPDQQFSIVALSSVLHEIQSSEGFKGVSSVFGETIRILAPDGVLLMREFVLPRLIPSKVELKTSWAKRFFEAFAENFRREQRGEWRNEWWWNRDKGDTIRTNSKFAWEIFLHARMFRRECEERESVEEKRAFQLFPYWRELDERYTLATPEHDPSRIAYDLLQYSGEANGHWYISPWRIKDTVDDTFLNKNFSYWESGESTDSREMKQKPIEMERMWIFFNRLSEDANSSKANGLAREMREFLDKLPGVTCLQASFIER